MFTYANKLFFISIFFYFIDLEIHIWKGRDKCKDVQIQTLMNQSWKFIILAWMIQWLLPVK